MAVILDTDMLTLFLKPEIPPPNDPATNLPTKQAAARVELLIEGLAKSASRVLIPATVWAEFLVAAGDDGPAFSAKLKDRANFEIVPFDAISAVEAAIDQRSALKAGNKKTIFTGSRQCVKADRQIVAVGKTRGVDAIYTADKDIINIGASMGVNVVPLWQLPTPPEQVSSTPLVDLMDDETSSIASVPPLTQSPGDGSAKGPAPAPSRPSNLHVAPGLQLPGSSPTVPPPPPSKK